MRRAEHTPEQVRELLIPSSSYHPPMFFGAPSWEFGVQPEEGDDLPVSISDRILAAGYIKYAKPIGSIRGPELFVPSFTDVAYTDFYPSFHELTDREGDTIDEILEGYPPDTSIGYVNYWAVARRGILRTFTNEWHNRELFFPTRARGLDVPAEGLYTALKGEDKAIFASRALRAIIRPNQIA